MSDRQICVDGYIFKFYPLLVALFVILQIECIIFVNKQIDIFYLSSTVSGVTFPLNLLILAIVVNCYGKQCARQLIWINNIVVLQFAAYNFFIGHLNWSIKSQDPEIINAYQVLVPVFARVGLAAIFSENIANFLFVFIYSKYRNSYKVFQVSYSKEYLRMFIYAFISNFTMLMLSYSIIFWRYDFKYIVLLVCRVMLLKSIIEAIFSPIAIYVITKIKNIEGFGVRDISGNNPFKFLIKKEYLNFYQVIK